MLVTSDPGIEYVSPAKRGCLFHYEQPENHTLKYHKKYTQVNLCLVCVSESPKINLFDQATCKFECRIQIALLPMKLEDRCLPWYYHQVDPEARLCSPFEAQAMKENIDSISSGKCQVHICSKMLQEETA